MALRGRGNLAWPVQSGHAVSHRAVEQARAAAFGDGSAQLGGIVDRHPGEIVDAECGSAGSHGVPGPISTVVA